MKFSKNTGFTLVEVLVVLAITGVVASAILGFFAAQQRSHTAQEQVTFMQQNIRAGLGITSRELRMAGYDPARSDLMVFSNPDPSKITFRIDLNGDGDSADAGEEITYQLSAGELQRRNTAGGAFVVLADNIENVAFAFAYDSNSDGALDTDVNGVIYAIAGINGLGPLKGPAPNTPAGNKNWFRVHDNGTAVTDTGTLANAADIRAVRIWLLAKTDVIDPNYINTLTYNVGGLAPITPGDKFRRRLLDTVIRCRNMGLK